VVQGEVAGWVDHDHDPQHDWLGANEVNLGYFVLVEHRPKGYAARSVELFVDLLRGDKRYTTASLLIDPENGPSLAVARRCEFVLVGKLNGQFYFTRSVS
jgi:RimJ/RimL family protein N-acetyltransferase